MVTDLDEIERRGNLVGTVLVPRCARARCCMSESERLRETGRWPRFAHDDQRGAEALLEREDVPPRLACFFAQQAAKRAIKAALAAKTCLQGLRCSRQSGQVQDSLARSTA